MSKIIFSLLFLCGFQVRAAANDVYRDIFQKVDRSSVLNLLKDMSGVNNITVNGVLTRIPERQTETSKAIFRNYWTSYFTSLGMKVNDLAMPGHDFEAVLPGLSPDSIIVIVHYDSAGSIDNPGADDCMTGMSILMETARILSSYKGRLEHTVRFVAADFEESTFLGDKNYAQYIVDLAKKENFKVLAAIDDEQSGWVANDPNKFSSFSCALSGAYSDMAQRLSKVSQAYSGLTVSDGGCISGSDFNATADQGIPSITFSENDPFTNPYFDKSGDTFDIINQDYFFSIAQVGVAFTATIVGIHPQ
jgi:Zn-dependent M28 family amino/carboxypeptidase